MNKENLKEILMKSTTNINNKFLIEDIDEFIEKFKLYDILSLCLSFCSQDNLSVIDYDLLLNEAKDIDKNIKCLIKNTYIYFCLLPFVRETALTKLCDYILKKHRNLIGKYPKTETGISHFRFKELIDDYLAFDIEESDLLLFNEHMIACHSCKNIFVIYSDVVEIIKTNGKSLLIEFFTKDISLDCKKQVSEKIFLNDCIKKYFLKSPNEFQDFFELVRIKYKYNEFQDFFELVQGKYKGLPIPNDKDVNANIPYEEMEENRHFIDFLKNLSLSIIKPYKKDNKEDYINATNQIKHRIFSRASKKKYVKENNNSKDILFPLIPLLNIPLLRVFLLYLSRFSRLLM